MLPEQRVMRSRPRKRKKTPVSIIIVILHFSSGAVFAAVKLTWSAVYLILTVFGVVIFISAIMVRYRADHFGALHTSGIRTIQVTDASCLTGFRCVHGRCPLRSGLPRASKGQFHENQES